MEYVLDFLKSKESAIIVKIQYAVSLDFRKSVHSANRFI